MGFLLFQLFVNLCFLLFLIFMVLSIIKGAPYVRSKKKAISAMIELAKASPRDRILDFGAGDGEVVIAFAKAGSEYVRGVELNLFLVLVANTRILFAGKWKHARVYWGNMWWFKTTPYSVIIVYGFPSIMHDLESKLVKESVGERMILSNSFTFQHLSEIDQKDSVKRYSLKPAN